MEHNMSLLSRLSFVLLTENHITNAITQQRCLSFIMTLKTAHSYVIWINMMILLSCLFFSTAASQPSSTTCSVSSISGTGMYDVIWWTLHHSWYCSAMTTKQVHTHYTVTTMDQVLQHWIMRYCIWIMVHTSSCVFTRTCLGLVGRW